MSTSARSRPPRLDPGQRPPMEPGERPGLEQRLLMGRVAGPLRSIGPTELRHLVQATAAGDPSALGGLDPLPGCTPLEVSEALFAVWGATPDVHEIDPARTLRAAAEAARRMAGMAAAGARVVFATAEPASLLSVHMHLARLVGGAGADLPDEPDSPAFRCDGRAGRVLRRVGGVAVVTDGRSILATADGAAAEELLFGTRRPDLVVAAAPVAARAVRAPLPVNAMARPGGLGWGGGGLRGAPVTVVPVDTGRPPGAYGAVVEVMEEAFVAALGEAS